MNASTVGVLLAVITIATLPTGSSAQQGQPLPEAVQSFLEQDQVQRWARMIQVGDSLFNNGSCFRCHGEGGGGTQRAPNLTDTDWSQSEGALPDIFRTIMWGVERDEMSQDFPFEMNPGGGINPSWEEMRSLAAYVWSLSNGTHLPQRGG